MHGVNLNTAVALNYGAGLAQMIFAEIVSGM